jgi:hypothetical protein
MNRELHKSIFFQGIVTTHKVWQHYNCHDEIQESTSFSCYCISPILQTLNPRDNVCKAATRLLLISNELRLAQFNPIIYTFTLSATNELSARLKT